LMESTERIIIFACFIFISSPLSSLVPKTSPLTCQYSQSRRGVLDHGNGSDVLLVCGYQSQ
jgi:hypothetical protein